MPAKKSVGKPAVPPADLEGVHVHQHDHQLAAGGPLPEYYDCLVNGSSLVLRCRKCGKGYKLPAGSVHPGNRIALMNHVRTHSELEEI